MGWRHMVTGYHSGLGMTAAAAAAVAAGALAAGRKMADCRDQSDCGPACNPAVEVQCTGHSCWQGGQR